MPPSSSTDGPTPPSYEQVKEAEARLRKVAQPGERLDVVVPALIDYLSVAVDYLYAKAERRAEE